MLISMRIHSQAGARSIMDAALLRKPDYQEQPSQEQPPHRSALYTHSPPSQHGRRTGARTAGGANSRSMVPPAPLLSVISQNKRLKRHDSDTDLAHDIFEEENPHARPLWTRALGAGDVYGHTLVSLAQRTLIGLGRQLRETKSREMMLDVRKKHR